MKTGPAQNRRFALLLAAATLLHLLLLLVPVVRQQAAESTPSPSVTVRLSPQPLEAAIPEPEPEPAQPPEMAPVEPVELAELPPPDPEPTEPVEPGPAAKPAITAHRILSELREKQIADPLAAFTPSDQDDKPDYYVRFQPTLEDVLNEPSLQLPFRDTRIYLVDSYDTGFMGGVQRFFDEVTVPFGFTTKNNTRVQCAWILVIAGCSWGDASSYYNAQYRARKRKPEPM